MGKRGVTSERLAISFAILFVVVSGSFAACYLEEGSMISQKNQLIASLESSLSSQQVAAAVLDAQEAKLNATILSLNAEIVGLKMNASASSSQIQTLEVRLGKLENQSALDSVEFGILYEADHLSVGPLLVNATVSLPLNGSQIFGSSSGGPDQVLAFVSNGGCPVSGIRVVGTQPQVIAIQLDSNVPLVKSYFNATNGLPYTIEFANVGHAAVECTYSLFLIAP